MGLPPNRWVLNKLVKKFFLRFSQTTSSESVKLRDELVNCWQKYGVGHEKCLTFIDKFDLAWALDFKERETYVNELKKYPKIVQSVIEPARDPMYDRGRKSTPKRLYKPLQLPDFY